MPFGRSSYSPLAVDDPTEPVAQAAIVTTKSALCEVGVQENQLGPGADAQKPDRATESILAIDLVNLIFVSFRAFR